jgi:hypothetical protein
MPKYPMYVVSFDRWQDNRRLTIREFERIGLPYTVVVEPEEEEKYKRVCKGGEVIVLPQRYHDEFEACVPREPGTRQGAGPARNLAWDDAVERGFERHWLFDDNVSALYRVNNNLKIRIADPTVFKVMEDFVDRYVNVALAGPNYETFVHRKYYRPPFVLNTRIYSMTLVKNDIPYRWRGRYNEDTDLSLRVLKDGWCTILFNAFVGHKMATQTVKGGLTDQIYMKEGTYAKSKLIEQLHPDVTKMVWRFGRIHHFVDYSRFKKNRLRKKPGIVIPDKPNEYGMRLVKKSDS